MGGGGGGEIIRKFIACTLKTDKNEFYSFEIKSYGLVSFMFQTVKGLFQAKLKGFSNFNNCNSCIFV